MNICYECDSEYDINDQLKNEINCCLMKVGASIFDNSQKNEHEIRLILVKMLLETCEFIISQNYVIYKTKPNTIINVNENYANNYSNWVTVKSC